MNVEINEITVLVYKMNKLITDVLMEKKHLQLDKMQLCK